MSEMVTHFVLRKLYHYYVNKYFSWLVNEQYRSDVYAVYEVLECRAKVQFTRALPYTIMSNITQPSSIVGILLHEGFSAIFAEENRENRVFSKTVIVDGREYTINGWPDYYDGQRVIELKFTSHPIREADQKHIQQVRMYMWLTGAKEGYLLYVTPRRIYEFKISEPMSDEEVASLIRDWPSPRDPSECSQCTFRNVCPYCKIGSAEYRSAEAKPIEA